MEWTAAGDTLFVGHFVSVTQEGLFFARGLFLGLLKYPQDYFFVVIGTHLSASLWPKAAEMWVFRVLVVKESTPDRRQHYLKNSCSLSRDFFWDSFRQFLEVQQHHLVLGSAGGVPVLEFASEEQAGTARFYLVAVL